MGTSRSTGRSGVLGASSTIARDITADDRRCAKSSGETDQARLSIVPSSDAEQVAAALRVSVGLLVRRLRQVQAGDEVTLPQFAALARLDRGGPATSSELAKREQISPQSMGATLSALEALGLIERAGDPEDGRRVVLSLTAAGMQVLRERRGARVERMAHALSDSFTPEELEQLRAAVPLLERLTHNV